MATQTQNLYVQLISSQKRNRYTELGLESRHSENELARVVSESDQWTDHLVSILSVLEDESFWGAVSDLGARIVLDIAVEPDDLRGSPYLALRCQMRIIHWLVTRNVELEFTFYAGG